jgi:hypothetical protein
MKNTLCENCLFADHASSQSPCEHEVIKHIKDTKTLNIVNDFYIIEDYMCKMGFSRSAFDSNSEKYCLKEIKQEILKRACIKYYLVMDITDADEEQIARVCSKINELKIPPKYISFLIFSENSKDKIKSLEQSKITSVEWKAHSFIADVDKNNGLHLALDTNLKKNNSQLLLFYNIDDIDDLDQDINEINTIVNIEQPAFHVLKKNNKENTMDGLFLSFDSYEYAKSQNKDIIRAINDLENTIILNYGTK